MNPQSRRIFVTALRIPIFVAIALAMVLLAMHLQGALQMLFIGVLFALIVGRLVWYGVYSSKMSKKIDALLDILYKEVKPEKFIAESEKALNKTKMQNMRNTISINLAVGYEAIGRFDEAIRILKSIDITTSDKISKAMFYANATSFYAENGSPIEASEAYVSGKPYFEKAAKRLPMAHLKLSRGLLYFAEGQYEDAADAFEKARGLGFDDRHTLNKTQLFEARALANMGKTKEAKALYRKILQKKTYPYLLSCAKAELESLEKGAE